MSNHIQLGDSIQIISVEPSLLSNVYIGQLAKVIEINENGSIRAELLYCNNSILQIEQFVTLLPGAFEKVTLQSFDVFVARTGYVPNILAADSEQAMCIVNKFVWHDDISWSDDWSVTDAQLSNE